MEAWDAPDTVWPKPGLHRVPPQAVALSLARWVRCRLSSNTRASELAEVLGIPVRSKVLRPGSKLQALLLPDRASRFVVICNAAGGNLHERRQQFRIGHELAHTLFYDWSQALPKRMLDATEAEERFCDAFARQVCSVTAAN